MWHDTIVLTANNDQFGNVCSKPNTVFAEMNFVVTRGSKPPPPRTNTSFFKSISSVPMVLLLRPANISSTWYLTSLPHRNLSYHTGIRSCRLRVLSTSGQKNSWVTPPPPSCVFRSQNTRKPSNQTSATMRGAERSPSRSQASASCHRQALQGTSFCFQQENKTERWTISTRALRAYEPFLSGRQCCRGHLYPFASILRRQRSRHRCHARTESI